MDGVKKLHSAYELKDGLKEFMAHKKYVEVLIGLSEEKKGYHQHRLVF